MDQLSELRACRRVAEAGSFSAAAAAVNVSHTGVSRQVRQPEDRLGVQPINRTTRKIALTGAGRGYCERARPIADDLQDADLAMAQHHTTTEGRLRINSPMALGTSDLALQLAVLGGTGIATTASFNVQNDLAQESMAPVQLGYPKRSRSLYAVYPQSHHVSAKVRAFVEFAAGVYRWPAWS